MIRIVIRSILVLAALACSTKSAPALPPFKPVFEKRYVQPDTPIAEAFKTGSCAMCHVKGGERTPQNPYGEELNKRIAGVAKERLATAEKRGADAKQAEEAQLIKELEAAFSVVEKLPIDPKDKSGPTWGDRLKANLPPIDPEKNKPAEEQ